MHIQFTTLMRLSLFVALCTVALPALAQRSSPESFLPAGTAGWRLAESPQLFVGDELFRMIDGGAVLYHEYGFDRAASAHYQDSAGRMVDAEIYAMSDAGAAYGIFGITAAAGDSTLALGDEGEMGEYFLVFRKGRYVVTVSGQNSERPTLDGVRFIGQAIQARIDSSAPPPPIVQKFNPLVGKGSRPIYLRGAVAVGNFYIFAPQNVFNVREGVTGERDSTRFFVFRYASADKSAQILRAAGEALHKNEKYSRFETSSTGFQAIDRDGNLLRASVADKSIVIIIGRRADLSKEMEQEILEVLKRS